MLNLFIPQNQGTHVLGSSYGVLNTVRRAYHGDNFVHRTRATLQYEDNWLFADCDPEISKYYAWMIERRFGIRLLPNKRSSHISLIRGEEVQSAWKYRDGAEIEVCYSAEVYTNGLHWWLNTSSPDFVEIRQHYGLPTEFEDYNLFHLTVGRSSIRG